MSDSQMGVSSEERAGGDVEDKEPGEQEVKDEGPTPDVEDVGQEEATAAEAEAENESSEVEPTSEVLSSMKSFDTLATEGGLDEGGSRGDDQEDKREDEGGSRSDDQEEKREDEGGSRGDDQEEKREDERNGEVGASGEEIKLEGEDAEVDEGSRKVEDTGNEEEMVSETGDEGNRVRFEPEEERGVDGESPEGGESEMTSKTEVEEDVDAGTTDGDGEEKADEGQPMDESQGEEREEEPSTEEREESDVGDAEEDLEAYEGNMAPIVEDEEADEEQKEKEPIESIEPAQFVLRKPPVDDFNLEPEFDENELLFQNEYAKSETSVEALFEGVNSGGADEADEVEEVLAAYSMDRETYNELCRKQQVDRIGLRRRNSVLQRKMMLHHKKRRTNKAIFEPEVATPAQESYYEKKLAQFGEAQSNYADAKLHAAEEVDTFEQQIAERTGELSELLDALVEHERDKCATMVSLKSGKPLAERLVERLLRRQKESAYSLGDARRAYIRAMQRVSDLENAIRGMEDLGQNLKLVDFEQLRIENQHLADKVEEREEELAKFLARAKHTKAALSHYRLKWMSVNDLIQQQKEKLKSDLEELDTARSELNTLKLTRDKLRADFARESELSGLLTKPLLLRDFEETLDECAAQRAQLQQLRLEVAQEQLQLEAIRALVPVFQQETKVEPRKRITTFMDRVRQRAQRGHQASSKLMRKGSSEMFVFL